MTSAIMRDATVASAGQKEHLIFKRVRVQAIGVVEDNGLPCPPIFKIEFCAVSRGNGAHGITDGTAGRYRTLCHRWLPMGAVIGPL